MPATAGPEIERLIQLLARLPGLGPRSARRAALFLIKKRELVMAPLAAALQTAMDKIEVCKTCGNIDTQNPCTVCIDPRRDASAIVVVADVADLWALERAHAINARYHVLGGTLSPLDGIGPDDLSIDALVTRAHEPAVREIILALNATVDGRARLITLPTYCTRPTSRSHAWRMACRLGANLIILTRELWRRRSVAARRFETSPLLPVLLATSLHAGRTRAPAGA